jgi:hypothetical protein
MPVVIDTAADDAALDTAVDDAALETMLVIILYCLLELFE